MRNKNYSLETIKEMENSTNYKEAVDKINNMLDKIIHSSLPTNDLSIQIPFLPNFIFNLYNFGVEHNEACFTLSIIENKKGFDALCYLSFFEGKFNFVGECPLDGEDEAFYDIDEDNTEAILDYKKRILDAMELFFTNIDFCLEQLNSLLETKIACKEIELKDEIKRLDMALEYYNNNSKKAMDGFLKAADNLEKTNVFSVELKETFEKKKKELLGLAGENDNHGIFLQIR